MTIANLVPGIAQAKLIGLIFVSILIGSMAVTIYTQSAKIDSLKESLTTSEANNKILNTIIENQNAKIVAANAKFEQIQKQLHIANGTNRKLAESFKELRGDINSRPIPKDCGAIISEMIEVSKRAQKSWEK